LNFRICPFICVNQGQLVSELDTVTVV